MQTRLKRYDVPRENMDNAIAIGFIGKTEIQYTYVIIIFITVFFYDVLSKFLSIGIIFLLLNDCTEIFHIKILIVKES